MSKFLVVGGAGTIGGAFVKSVLSEYEKNTVCVYSRSELHQHELKRTLSQEDSKRVGYFIGDIKDLESLRKCVRSLNPDVIVATAAMKRIEVCEANPVEALMVNAVGIDNVCRVATEVDSVHTVLYTSTDKASDPAGVYGNTKAIAEAIMKNYANTYFHKRFVTTRFANVLGSNGSVVPIFNDRIQRGKPITVRGNDMTRFFLDQDDAVSVMWSAINGVCASGEILVPQCRSLKVRDLAEVMIERSGKSIPIETVEPLPYEKTHEVLVSKNGLKHLKKVDGGFYILDLAHSNSNPPEEILSNNSAVLLTKEQLKLYL
jgi:UDP-N-acetylglucosamine 4,6-dehydratase/5-epimerase